MHIFSGKRHTEENTTQQGTDGDNIRGKCKNVGKVIYYTQTTHIIQELLPLECFWWDDGRLSNEQRINLENFFDVKMDLICIYFFTQATTFQKVKTILKIFFEDEISEVLLFVADMKCISPEIVNQTRIMIAEIEYLYANRIGCNKLLVLLLHFPSSLTNKSCYPTIFQRGWDHYYLDSVGGKINIDIVSWLSQCCFDLPMSRPFITTETLLSWLMKMLPMISADIGIKRLSGWPNVKCMTDCVKIWKNFLVEMKTADVLMNRFMSYWTASKIIEVSNKASIAFKTTSSLGMMGKIETEVHEAFKDFVFYMLSFINKQNGLHVLFLKEGKLREMTLELFLNLLSQIPLPLNLDYFKASIYNNRKKVNQISHSRALTFPFFRLIFKFVESILDVAINDFYDLSKETSEQQTANGDCLTIEVAFNQPMIVDSVIDLLFTKIESKVITQ